MCVCVFPIKGVYSQQKKMINEVLHTKFNIITFHTALVCAVNSWTVSIYCCCSHSNTLGNPHNYHNYSHFLNVPCLVLHLISAQRASSDFQSESPRTSLFPAVMLFLPGKLINIYLLQFAHLKKKSTETKAILPASPILKGIEWLEVGKIQCRETNF